MTNAEIIELLEDYADFDPDFRRFSRENISKAITNLQSQKTVEDVKKYCYKRLESIEIVKLDNRNDKRCIDNMNHRIREVENTIYFIDTHKQEDK